jgi:hypothetical protein
MINPYVYSQNKETKTAFKQKKNLMQKVDSFRGKTNAVIDISTFNKTFDEES